MCDVVLDVGLGPDHRSSEIGANFQMGRHSHSHMKFTADHRHFFESAVSSLADSSAGVSSLTMK